MLDRLQQKAAILWLLGYVLFCLAYALTGEPLTLVTSLFGALWFAAAVAWTALTLVKTLLAVEPWICLSKSQDWYSPSLSLGCSSTGYSWEWRHPTKVPALLDKPTS